MFLGWIMQRTASPSLDSKLSPEKTPLRGQLLVAAPELVTGAWTCAPSEDPNRQQVLSPCDSHVGL